MFLISMRETISASLVNTCHQGWTGGIFFFSGDGKEPKISKNHFKDTDDGVDHVGYFFRHA